MEKIRVSPKIRKMIDDMSIEELQFFANLGKNKDFGKFKDFVRRMIDDEKEYFFNFKENDPQALAIEKSHSRGKVASLTELVYIITGSVVELEKRLKNE